MSANGFQLFATAYVMIFQRKRALKQGRGLRVLVGLYFESAVKSEYIGIPGHNLCQLHEQFFSLTSLSRACKFENLCAYMAFATSIGLLGLTCSPRHIRPLPP